MLIGLDLSHQLFHLPQSFRRVVSRDRCLRKHLHDDPGPDGCHLPIPSMVAEIGPGASDVISVEPTGGLRGGRCFVILSPGRRADPTGTRAQTVPSSDMSRRVREPVDRLGEPLETADAHPVRPSPP